MPTPRVIATDLDGTLLRFDGTLSPLTLQVLARATAAGVRVVLSTARPPRATDAIAAQVDHAAVVCGNGSHIRRPHVPEPLVRAMTTDATRTVVEKLRQVVPEVGFGVETGEVFFHDPDYVPGPRSLDREMVYSTNELLERATPVTKLVARSHAVPMHVLYESAVEAVGPLAEVTYSGALGLLELSAPGVDKGSTLALLCAEWGVSAAEVAAFGDMPNDLSALSWAGAGYAMANSHPDLLDPALGLLIAPSHQEDGVARVVERLLNGRFDWR